MFASHQWRETRPVASLLLGFLICAAARERRLQDEVEVDFEPALGDQVKVGTHEVVTGYLYVKGEYSLESLGDIAYASRQMLSQLCDSNLPAVAWARQDILTLNAPRIGLNMTFYVLPPTGYSHHCVAMLRFAAFGPTEPPFDVPAPPVRQLLEASVAQNTIFNEELMADWVVDLGNVNCKEALVSHGAGDNPKLLLERSRMPEEWQGREEPAPCGSVEAKWQPASNVKFPWEEDPCKAAATPCICASIHTCRYVVVPSGAKRCTNGWQTALDVTSVSCADCPYQPKCPPTCQDAYTPCTCSFWNCTWDASSQRCSDFNPEAEALSCRLCARQAHCVGLHATRVDPLAWSFLSEEGWLVNVTFNRRIMFGPLVTWEPRALHFRCRGDAPGDDFLIYDVSLESAMILEDTLQVDTRHVPIELRRYCELTIYEGALLDMYYIPFSGIWRSHMLILEDTVKPSVASLWPENAALEVPLNVVLQLTFSERVRWTPTASLSLVSLGGMGDRPKDQVLQVFDAASARVQMDGQTIRLDLEGLLQHDLYYSVAMVDDSVRDLVGNSFSELAVGHYTFRTVAFRSSGSLARPSSALPVTLALLLVFLVVVLLIILALRWPRPKGTVEPEAPEDLESVKDFQVEHRNFESLFRELKHLEDEGAVTYRPELDDNYYATMDPLSTNSSTVLEPDLTIVNQARPSSAPRSPGPRPTSPSRWTRPSSATGRSRPSSAGVRSELGCRQVQAFAPEEDPPALTDAPPTPHEAGAPARLSRTLSRSFSRPISAHESGKLLIKRLHDSHAGKALPALSRPQSAPAWRHEPRQERARVRPLSANTLRRSQTQGALPPEPSAPPTPPAEALSEAPPPPEAPPTPEAPAEAPVVLESKGEELRSLGLVGLARERRASLLPSARPRQARVSVVAEQGSDLESWAQLLQHSEPSTRLPGEPEVEAVEALPTKAEVEEPKPRAIERQSYIWEFMAKVEQEEEGQEEEEEEEEEEVEEDKSVGDACEATGSP